MSESKCNEWFTFPEGTCVQHNINTQTTLSLGLTNFGLDPLVLRTKVTILSEDYQFIGDAQ